MGMWFSTYQRTELETLRRFDIRLKSSGRAQEPRYGLEDENQRQESGNMNWDRKYRWTLVNERLGDRGTDPIRRTMESRTMCVEG